MASFYFRYGAMNCGKSTALLQVAHNYEEMGYLVSILKPKVDTKGENKVISRLGISKTVDYWLDDGSLMELGKQFYENGVACILVDEAQFLSEEQVLDLYRISKYYDIPVICYGLRSTFDLKNFKGSDALFRCADVLEEMVTICSCGKKAKFQARKINGKYVMDGEEIMIDGTNLVEYVPMCGECYFKIYDQFKTKVKRK